MHVVSVAYLFACLQKCSLYAAVVLVCVGIARRLICLCCICALAFAAEEADSQPRSEINEELPTVPLLPAIEDCPSSPGETKRVTLGDTVKFDHLGPIISA
jgi:hypothetical protein